MIIDDNQWWSMIINDNQWKSMIINDNQWLISHEISWWDISLVEVSLLCQWYLTELVGEIFLWYKIPG